MSGTDCFICAKENLSKNEVGLNKKLLGRYIKQFYCVDCLAEYFEIEVDFLLEKAQEFRKQGCTLFE